MTLASAFTDYADRPARQTLAALHAAILALPDFERATPWLSRAEELASQQRHDEVIRWVSDQMPGALFCVLAHQMLSHSYDRIGDRESSRREAYHAHLALTAILDSGAGTEQSPWRVLHVADEYAVLHHHLAVEPVAQESRRSSDGEIVDVIETADGARRWFSLV